MARTKSKGTGPGIDSLRAHADRLAGKWAVDKATSATLQADWGEVSPALLHTLTCEVGRRKGAVLAGVDRMGAGFTVSVFLSGKKVLNQWYRGDAEGLDKLHVELEDFLNDLCQGENTP